jgi:Fur family ferric uptake transcriptional regulator
LTTSTKSVQYQILVDKLLQLESQETVKKGLKENSVVATISQLQQRTCESSEDRSSLLAELARSGVRITEQRRVLVEVIENSGRELDAAVLLEPAKKQDPGIDRATVYCTIALLKTCGLIDELDLRQVEPEHFYRTRANRDQCRMACIRCAAVVEYAGPVFAELKTEMSKRGSFLVRALRVQAVGFCGDRKQSAEK